MRNRPIMERLFRPVLRQAALAIAALSILSWLPQPAFDQAPGVNEEKEKLVSLLLDNSFREAGKTAEAILDGLAEDPEIRALCGLALLKMGRIDVSEAIFKEVLSLSPDNPEAHLGMGRLGRIRNDSESAVRHLRRAAESKYFYEEALRQLWRAARDRGLTSDFENIYRLTENRFQREQKSLPGWIVNSRSQLSGLKGKNICQMTGDFERIPVPLLREEGSRIRMISLRLNGENTYPFDIDSASPDFITVSPLLAEELGLRETGNSSAVGVGTAAARVRFSVVDRVDMGGITFRNVPVMVSDLHTFRGEKKGLIGTGFLKRFNCTIDVRKERMDLFPLDRPELLKADINPSAVAAEVPLYIFDATAVEAVMAGGPAGLFILDSAASTNLVDSGFFADHLKPKMDPALIRSGSIVGSQGTQRVNVIDALSIKLGPLAFNGQRACEFSMDALNDITGRYAAGLVGNPLLWPYRVHFDFRGGRLILERYPE